MKRQWIVMPVALVLLAVAGGCDNGNEAFTSDDSLNAVDYDVLVETRSRWIRDVPLPIGFELMEDRSLHFSAGDSRYIAHLYKGREKQRAVLAFYRGTMARYHWHLVSDDLTQGDITLDYRKGAEKCVIVIRGKGSLFSPTYIKINVMWTGSHVSAPMGPEVLPGSTR